jgi:hypothetical protein
MAASHPSFVFSLGDAAYLTVRRWYCGAAARCGGGSPRPLLFFVKYPAANGFYGCFLTLGVIRRNSPGLVDLSHPGRFALTSYMSFLSQLSSGNIVAG